MKTAEQKNHRRRVNLLKLLAFSVVGLSITLFFRATMLRVEKEVGMAGVASFPALVLGFLVLFLGGVCYGLWILLLEHYIAFSLTREWLVGILKESAGFGDKIRDKHKYAV